MTLDARLVAEEEGPSSPTVYPDSRGYWTIARGCLVDRSIPGAGLCPAALDAQDAYSLAKARNLAADLPGWLNCSDVRQAVLVSMCYQLGALADWPKFKGALALGDYGLAAAEMLYENPPNTAWSDWRRQTQHRCERAAYMMQSDTWLDHGAPIPPMEHP